MAFDVFISYAREDETLVDELATRLDTLGLSVWQDKAKLQAGDELGKDLALAIRNSRYAVLVLGPAYLAKEWTRRELSLLIDTHRERLIPVITPELGIDEIKRFSPTLADRLALTAARSALSARASDLEEIARKIQHIVKQSGVAGWMDKAGASRLKAIRARHWIQHDERVVEEIANLYPDTEGLRMILRGATDLLTACCSDAPVVGLADVPWGVPARTSWDIALGESAKRDPRTLAGLLLMARARAGTATPEIDRLLAAVEAAPAPDRNV